MPFWDIAHHLTSLEVVTIDEDLVPLVHGAGERVEEQLEEAFALVQVPPSTPFPDGAAFASHLMAVACRTIIAAAKGGQLKHLQCCSNSQYPRCSRAGSRCYTFRNDGCLNAAAMLRPLLAHLSLWMGTEAGARHDRYLSPQEIQSLRSYFSDRTTPKPYYHKRWGEEEEGESPVKRYLPWLEDVQLAEQSSEAWNAVVGRATAESAGSTCKTRKSSSMMQSNPSHSHVSPQVK